MFFLYIYIFFVCFLLYSQQNPLKTNCEKVSFERIRLVWNDGLVDVNHGKNKSRCVASGWSVSNWFHAPTNRKLRRSSALVFLALSLTVPAAHSQKPFPNRERGEHGRVHYEDCGGALSRTGNYMQRWRRLEGLRRTAEFSRLDLQRCSLLQEC